MFQAFGVGCLLNFTSAPHNEDDPFLFTAQAWNTQALRSVLCHLVLLPPIVQGQRPICQGKLGS